MLPFALSTRWNAGRHTSGEALIDEILALGFTRVELGYDLRIDLVSGVKNRIEENAVKVGTVHNFCPVPMGAPRGHPELFTFASKDERIRKQAVKHTIKTIEFASECGADTVVTHSGNVEMKRFTMDLVSLLEHGQQFTPRYEKLRFKMQQLREKKARKQLPHIYRCLDELIPALQEHRITLAIENLPTWEAFLTEVEMVDLLAHYAGAPIASWYDLGHGQIRENLGLINQERWLERLSPRMAGMHVHDVMAPARDHVMPPRGDIDFAAIRKFGTLPFHRVIEPSPRTPSEDLATALEFLNNVWGEEPHEPTTGESEA